MPENDEVQILNRYGLTMVKKIFDVLGATPEVNIFCECYIRPDMFSITEGSNILFLFFEKDRPETIFAPTDAAFAALPPGLLDSLLADKNKLFKFINNHIVSSYEYSRGLESGPVITPFGVSVDVKVSPGELKYGTWFIFHRQVILYIFF